VTFDRLNSLKIGKVKADLKPTEHKSRVLEALDNLFPSAGFEEKEGNLVAEVELSRFKELLEKEKIRPTVEAVLDENISDDESHIDLNKIAASAGRVAIDEGSPIGKIRLYVPWKKA